MTETSKTTFLIVDDSKIDLMIIERLVKQIHPESQVLTFIESPKALDYLKALNTTDMGPHIILLDIQMPIMDGFAFLDAYAQLPEDLRAGIRVLMMSSSTNNADVSRAKSHKYVETLLPKPLSRPMLSEAI